MRLIRSVLWYSQALPSMERCILREGPDHWCLEGTVLTLVETEPAEIHYALTCDRSWRTQRCTVYLERPTATGQIDLGVDETGSWFQNGTRIDGSGGVPDVDLGVTPSTNTIPIRRLALAPGEEARISVVWLRFPEFDAVVRAGVYQDSRRPLPVREWRFHGHSRDGRTWSRHQVRRPLARDPGIKRWGSSWHRCGRGHRYEIRRSRPAARRNGRTALRRRRWRAARPRRGGRGSGARSGLHPS